MEEQEECSCVHKRMHRRQWAIKKKTQMEMYSSNCKNYSTTDQPTEWASEWDSKRSEWNWRTTRGNELKNKRKLCKVHTKCTQNFTASLEPRWYTQFTRSKSSRVANWVEDRVRAKFIVIDVSGHIRNANSCIPLILDNFNCNRR